MNASLSGCSCGCSPCGCGAAPPCQDFNPPRPCFFPGQLVTADDLNAVMTYVQSRERLIMQLTGGWGILGGFQVQGVGTKSFNLLEQAGQQPFVAGVTVNPQVVPGSAIQVTPGAAIDSSGRLLNRSLAQPLDLQKASQGLGLPQRTATCAEWLGAEFCNATGTLDITAAEFWLIAEYTETPTRPMPALAGGGQCETGALCDFTRKQPGVKFSLVKDLPRGFFIHGCLEAPDVPGIDTLIDLIATSGGNEGGGGGGGGTIVGGDPLSSAAVVNASNPNTGANTMMRTDFSCLAFRSVPQIYELLANISWGACCSRPAIALGRLLLVTQSEQFEEELGESPYYVLIDQGFPYRRQTPSNAAFQMMSVIRQANEICAGGE